MKCEYMDMAELIDKKKSLFNRVFGMKYSLKLLEMQTWDNKDGRELAEVSLMLGEMMTALDIHVVCEKIARWLGGELYGTVNLDFSGNSPSLEMMIERDLAC